MQPAQPPKPIYDKGDQLKQLEEVLIPGEWIEAVFDCKGAGTGFVGITNKRVVFHDKQFLRKLKAVVSVPYSRITSIATHDESGLLTGRGFFGSSKITITTAHGDHEFEFRGADKAHTAHNLILSHMV
jgi:Bacterial PH domain